MSELIRHFASGPSGPPATEEEHGRRYQAIMDDLASRRLTSRKGDLETGHTLVPEWSDADGQWMGITMHPPGSSAWNREGEYHPNMPLGTVDSEVPDRVAAHFRTPEFLDYLRRTIR